LVRKVSPLQIGLVGLEASRGRRSAAGRRQAEPQRRGHAERDVVLECEDVLDPSVVAVGPRLVPRLDVGEAHVDAEAVADALYGALEDVPDAQLASGLAAVHVRAAVLQRAVARYDEHPGNLGQLGADRLAHSLGEIVFFRTGGQRAEWEHRDRPAARGRHRRRMARRDEQDRRGEDQQYDEHRRNCGRAPAKPAWNGVLGLRHAQPVEILQQVARGGIPPPRVLGEAALDDPLQLAGRVAVPRTDRGRLVVQQGRDCGGSRAPLEGALARRHLVEQRPQGELVRAEVSRLAARLLRRHVAHRAEDGARARGSGSAILRRSRLVQLGQAEVEDLHEAVVGVHHVLRLQVAVDDAGLVCLRQARRELRRDVDQVAQRQRPRGDPLAKGAAPDQFGRDERNAAFGADVVDGEDIGMVQGRGGPGLPLEPPEPVAVGL
jgi:hypothetical protein